MNNKKFKQIRKNLALNQKNLGEIIGIHQVTVSDIECDVRPPTKLQAFAMDALHFLDRHGLLYKFISRRKP